MRVPGRFYACATLAATLALVGATACSAGGHSLRFFGTGNGDVDRVKIRIDDPATTLPGPPVDVGAGDFTLEFWLKATLADNPAATITCGANEEWTRGNVVVDRDRFNQGRKFGVSLAGGRVVFGVTGTPGDARTICGVKNVADGAWHHVAVQRRRADGRLELYVDGALDAQSDGPDGDLSYPDDGVPGNFCSGPCTASDPFLVIGASKRSATSGYPSYRGLLDELRVSNVLRYAGNFPPPSTAFAADVHTMALHHFDEGTGTNANDAAFVTGGPSDGELRVGGTSAGPHWSTESPFDVGTPSFTLRPLNVTGLVHPVEITHAGDGSGRLFIVEQPGRIRIYRNGALLATPFLDISTTVESTATERGLLGLAFHPGYRTSGLFYVFYTAKAGPGRSIGDLVVEQYRVSANPDLADASSARTVLRIAHAGDNHNGGKLAFGHDGYLYVATGDGGGGGDPLNNGQNLSSLLGKLLRIDVNGAPYAIPPANPFSPSTIPPGLPEIWAYGLRNPWRFAFDRLTGDLFVGDVGQGAWEEVNFQRAGSPGGQNYGWRVFEGTHCYNPPSGCALPNHTPPVIEYDHGVGISVTGGFRYRGAANPTLAAQYLFADFGSGRVWTAQAQASGQWTYVQATTVSLPAAFGEDEDGELYVASYGGAIHQLVPRDSDVDGLPDWWEQAYFGSPTSASPDGDADTDGATNLQEFAAGTDPRDRTSRPARSDLTRDRLTDILWRNRFDGTLALWVTNLGIPETGSGSIQGLPVANWSVRALADVDGDGHADILWQDDSGHLVLWLMQGLRVKSALSPTIGWVSPLVWRFVGAGDFDGDGRADYLWQNTVDSSLSVWLMRGATAATTTIPGAPRSYWTAAGLGDFDGDGRADILWRSIAGDVSIWRMNGATVVARGPAGTGYASTSVWSLAGIADFNGDGPADLLWRNSVDGSFGLWLISGFTELPGSAAFPGADPGYWNVAGVGDFDGDGRADILWRSVANEVGAWLMNGATPIGTRRMGQGWTTSNWVLLPE